jgi:hypothetical protein
MQNPFDDQEVIKIATLKRTKAVEQLSRELSEQQSQKKADLARRGLLQSGAFVKTMLDLNLKRLERIVYAHYSAWKEALTEAGYPLTSDNLRRIADEAGKTLDNEPSSLMGSLKHQSQGMTDIVEKMQRGIEQDVESIRARFRQDYEIDISKAKIAERNAANERLSAPLPSKTAQDFSFVRDGELRRVAERDYAELQTLNVDTGTKSVLIMSGSIIEGLLLDATVTAGTITKDKAAQMTLEEFLAAASKSGIVREDRVSHAVRKYRNLIHPAREIRDKIVFTSADATLARAAVDVIIQDIRSYLQSKSLVDSAPGSIPTFPA